MDEGDSDDDKKLKKTEMGEIIEKDRMKLNKKLRRLFSQEIINESDEQLVDNLDNDNRAHASHNPGECEVVIEEPHQEEDQPCTE